MFGKQKDKPVEEPADGWFDLATMADIFSVTPQSFWKTNRPLIDPKDIRNATQRGRVMIHARGAIDSWVAHKVQAATKNGADPLLVGGDSLGLERYRLAKAELAEMDVQLRQKTHVDINTLNAEMMQFAAIIRRSGDALQRQFGNDAAKIVSGAIDAAVRQWKENTEVSNG